MMGKKQLLPAILAVCAIMNGCTQVEHANSTRLNNQGVEYLTSNDLNKAHAKFVESWKQDPANADTLYNLASTYHRRGQTREAEQYYRQALQINPDHVACRHNYYLLLVEQNRALEARDDASRWAGQRKQSADALAQLGWLTRLQGDLPNAQKTLEQALTLEPHNTEALLEMGKLYQDYQMNDRARGLYRRVLQHDPNNQEANTLLVGLAKK